jgi:transketolase
MLVGGSADLGPSNNTDIKEGGSFEAGSYEGRILHFGVREHAMGSTLTGMSLNGGLIPFGGTFMCFSDYMKPAIRLAALSHVQVVYVFTHDSVGLGEDGPTHQPIEQLAGLRAIPNLYVIRPADVHETREAWRLAILRQHAPTALVLTRQKLPLIDRTNTYASAEGTRRGAYVLADATDAEGKPTTPKLILLSTGSEVSLCLEARETLQTEGTPTRVVSMPCWDLFEEQEKEYRESVIPSTVKARLGVEAAASLGWHRWVGDSGDVLCLDQFGASAPGATALKELGFNTDNLTARARALLNG